MAKNDEVIKQLMAKVAEQKEALGVKPKVSWKTNGVFKFDDKRYFNINVTDMQSLVEALAYMLQSSNTVLEAAKRLEVSFSVPMFGGYTVEEWEEDFKLRIAILKWEEKKKKLEETERKLAALVSEEARTEMELEKISKSLGL
jgi:TPP-dependent trihydroxycyclohexane-1,2-dione (THcHDO) dehydratase